MEISAIGASVGAPQSPQQRGLGSLKSEDFFKILVTELQNQDPFEPAKTTDMISQVSQIRSIELSGKLTDTLDSVARQQRLAGTCELIGKYVYAVTTAVDGTQPLTREQRVKGQTLHEGVVTGVRFDSHGVAVLELDSGEAVLARDVIRVTTLALDTNPPCQGLDEVEAQLAEADEAADPGGASASRRQPTIGEPLTPKSGVKGETPVPLRQKLRLGAGCAPPARNVS